MTLLVTRLFWGSHGNSEKHMATLGGHKATLGVTRWLLGPQAGSGGHMATLGGHKATLGVTRWLGAARRLWGWQGDWGPHGDIGGDKLTLGVTRWLWGPQGDSVSDKVTLGPTRWLWGPQGDSGVTWRLCEWQGDSGSQRLLWGPQGDSGSTNATLLWVWCCVPSIWLHRAYTGWQPYNIHEHTTLSPGASLRCTHSFVLSTAAPHLYATNNTVFCLKTGEEKIG